MGILFLSFVLCTYAGYISANLPSRPYVKTLNVTNGGPWGRWGSFGFCGIGNYAIGFEMKIEERLPRGRDDTSLNGVKLICGSKAGLPDGQTAKSSTGYWGDWRGEVRCLPGQVISSFALQVESPVGRHRDDTAANYFKVRCRNYDTSTGENQRYLGSGFGYWGEYGSWSQSCDANSAVCGIRTKLEGPQGPDRDDTALNDVQLFCCT